MIHYDAIGSGNTIMKNTFWRDELASKTDILCFDTGAAGLKDQFPCLVKRGISDHADSHSTDEWRGYAAMTAAAYGKDLLNPTGYQT